MQGADSRMLIQLLTPKHIPGLQMERWGSEADGGYVVPPHIMRGVSALLTGGIGDNVEFEAEVARRVPSVHIALFDHTVASLPEHAPSSAKWYKEGLGCRPGFLTLEGAAERAGIQPHQPIALKLDIEGAEWELLDGTSESFWKRVSILVIEFHQLNDKTQWHRYARLLRKLEPHLLAIHVHGNNHDSTVHFSRQGVYVPITLELTYVNRSLLPNSITPVPWSVPGPTALDRPNRRGVPDLPLNYWFPQHGVFFRRLKKNVGRMLHLRA